jgi:hypothetical protein
MIGLKIGSRSFIRRNFASLPPLIVATAACSIVCMCSVRPAAAQNQNNASPPATASTSAAMPEQWDSRIPLPKGAVLTSSTKPSHGVVYSADFVVPGDYKELVNFYEREIPKAGFKLNSKVAVPARKVYNCSFGRQDILDSIVISPRADDPSKYMLRITYTPTVKP